MMTPADPDSPYAWALAGIAGLALLTWVASLVRRDASLVDRVWPLFFVIAALSHGWAIWGDRATHGVAAWVPGGAVAGPDSAAWTGRAALVLLIVAAWGLRLSAYLSWRNWGHGEDRRYQAIRARNQPGFGWKSLYLIFALQAVLAWVITWPIGLSMGAASSLAGPAGLGSWDVAGALLALFGLGFEAVADAQMARFKADPAQRGQVMDGGLWGLCRHPNYFGEACVWWGVWLLALGATGWAQALPALVSPLLITGLLFKVSGVSLLEADIGQRRPAYADYMRRTPAFLPRWPWGRPARLSPGGGQPPGANKVS